MIARPPKANTGAGYPAWWWFYGEPGIRGRHFYFLAPFLYGFIISHLTSLVNFPGNQK
jgi:hypothetical protein